MDLGTSGIAIGFVLGVACAAIGARRMTTTWAPRSARRRFGVVLAAMGVLIALPFALFLSMVIGGSIGGSIGGLVGGWLHAPAGGALIGLAMTVAAVFTVVVLAGCTLGLLISRLVHVRRVGAHTGI